MKKLHLLASVALVGSVSVANAEDAPETANELVNPNTTVVTGAGIKVGEGTVIHPVVGIETGVVSNVFYENSDTNMAGIMRFLVELSTSSLSSERLALTNRDATDPALQSLEQGHLAYMASGYLNWDQYLSTNDNVTAQGGLGAGLLFKGIVNPNHTWSLGFLEEFNRLVRATNFESKADTNRDINLLTLRLAFQPRGRSLGGYAYWRNTIDYFEDGDQQFANRLQDTFGVRVNYQWLPLTRLYVDVSEGVFSGLGSTKSPTGTAKVDSYPLNAVAGIMTALTINTTFNARVGYTQGFYANGPDYATITGGLQFGYRYSPQGRVTAMYSYDHNDSINANFYRDHLLKLEIYQQFPPFAVDLGAELHLRQYEGVTEVTGIMPADGSDVRNDVIGVVNAGMRYQFRGWIAAVANYQFSAISTDFRYDAGGGFIENPSYIRHTLTVGVRAAY